MFETALKGVAYKGYVSVREAEPTGMISIRGDLMAPDLAAALKSVLTLSIPAPKSIVRNDLHAAAWMSPDELMCLCPYDERRSVFERLETALKTQHALVSEISDARSIITVSGSKAEEVIAKLCPVDVSALQGSEIRRTRLAQVPAALWHGDKGINVMCFRSVSSYVFEALCRVSVKGSEVF